MGLAVINQIRLEWGAKLEDPLVKDHDEIMLAKGVLYGLTLLNNMVVDLSEDRTDYDAEIKAVQEELEDERKAFSQ